MYELNKMQKEIRNAVKTFAKGEFDKELCYRLDKDALFPEEQCRKAGETGFLGVHFPEAFGGGALGSVENALVTEELCRKDSTSGSAVMFSVMGADLLLTYGSDSLKQKYLPELTAGNIVSSEAFSEQVSDDNWLKIDTLAEKKRDKWVLNGRKINVMNGKGPGILFILSRLEDGAYGIFLAESSMSGLNCCHKNESLGLRMLTRSDMVIENLHLPEENLVTVLPDGSDSSELQLYRAGKMIQLAAMATGVAKGAYDRTISYIKLREQFGKRVCDFQINRHKVADMATLIELASLILYKAASVMDSGKTDLSLCAMAKNTAAGNALKVTDEAIQLFGGYGYTTDYEVERFYRDAKVLGLIGGNSATLKEVIADQELGKSKR